MLSPSELGPSSDRSHGTQMWSPALPSSLFSARPQLEPTHLESLVLCPKGRLPDADKEGLCDTIIRNGYFRRRVKVNRGGISFFLLATEC